MVVSGIVPLAQKRIKTSCRTRHLKKNGQPSLHGWSPADSTMAKFSKSVPPNGGHYSITLEAAWVCVPSIHADVAAPKGNHLYRLSFWGKADGFGGHVNWGFVRGGEFSNRKSITISDASWTKYSWLDTLTTGRGDTPVVTLSGGFSHLWAGTSFFDLCRLDRLD